MQALGASPPPPTPVCVVLTALGAPARCRSHRFSLATLLEFPVPVFIVGYLRIVCWGVKILVLVIWDSLKMPVLARGVGCGLTLVEG